ECGVRYSFFCQAEDGIRGDLVTGVQTCALPISASSRQPDRLTAATRALIDYTEALTRTGLSRLPTGSWSASDHMDDDGSGRPIEIGRASCRERVWSGGGAASLDRQREEGRCRRR